MFRIYFAIMFLIISCKNNNSELALVAYDSVKSATTGSNDHLDSLAGFAGYSDFFIVISDTGTHYYFLRDKMMLLSRKMNIPVDTMGRHYDVKKDLIALPENDEDEIYAGDYFPRRFPSEHLSLEYLNFYMKGSGEKTIAIVSGIYDNEVAADKALAVLKGLNNNSFKLKASVYTGCMH